MVAVPTTHSNGNVAGLVERPARDWESQKRHAAVYDDGTTTFFWRAHRITVLLLFLLVLVYVTVFEEISEDSNYNMKRGLVATVLVFIVVGVTFMPDGPFIRPHPLFWRTMLTLQVLYQLALVFLLFQTADDARKLLKHVDTNLGEPLPEKNYGGNCLIYDKDHPQFPWHNLWNKLDEFVLMHFFGWWTKTLIVRDWWLCTVMSIMFEILEYSLEHQLPNFNECWWDHWIVDVVICNGLGIYLGLTTLKYLNVKTYHWRSLWSYPTYKGKIKRILLQFTPHSWLDFDWRCGASFNRWLGALFLMAIYLVVELNIFYLKKVLWIPSAHYLVIGRCIVWLFMGAVGTRELLQYYDDQNQKKLGTQAWLCISVMATECFIVLKFDWSLVTMPFPRHIRIFWIIFITGIIVWSFWHFYINRHFWHTSPKVDSKRNRSLKNENTDKGQLGNEVNNGTSKSNTTRSRISHRPH